MKFLGSTDIKISKDKNGQNVPYLEITEVVLVYSSIVNNKIIDKIHASGIYFFLINHLVNY